MKSHFPVEHFFHPRFRAQLGGILALLRVAFAYALVYAGWCVHTAMPDALVRLRVQVVPFLEALATVWSFSWWQGVLVVAGVALGLGLGTRYAAGAFLLFFAGGAIIDYGALVACMGPWMGVATCLLLVALCSQWGRVFGGDDIIARWGILGKKHKRTMRIF